MTRGRHAKRTVGSIVAVVAIAAGILLLALGGVAFAAYRYDQASADRILPGVTIAGVDVGGMTRAQAIDAVDRAAATRLSATLTVRAAGQTWTVTPSELGERADVEVAVDGALSDSSSVGFLARVWHRIRHEPMGVEIELRYGLEGSATQQLVATVAGAVARAPSDAAIEVVDRQVRFTHAHAGLALNRTRAARRIVAALNAGATDVRLPVKRVAPKVPDAKLGKSILVDTALNKLYLYDGFKLLHTYPVATAMDGYVTPSGTWAIVDKQENPTWYNPAPTTWGADLPASIPPGPGNPLGTRALYLNAPGIRIHGTYDTSSIGTHASHGCIRMLIPDVEQLYPLVPIGTRVIVFA
jgi:lipoprotein-anchoring transpeptidase ErfK/SrfK